MKTNMNRLLCFILSFCLLAASLVTLTVSAGAAQIGDVNGDSKVTAADARLALRAAVGLESYAKGSEKFQAADMNQDGAITAADARLILRMAVGLGVPAAASSAQYDILRSGTFYLEGSMSDGGAFLPLKLGVSSSLVYLESTVDGVTLGYLASGKNIYVLNPAKKNYCKVSGLTASLLGGEELMSEAELRSYIDELGISSMKNLSQANDVQDAMLNSTPCTAYTFNNANGTKTRVFISGSRLLGFDLINAAGQLDTRILIDSITATVPTLPPKDYSNTVTMILFAAGLADQLK